MRKTKRIDIMITKDSQLYNQFNNSRLSDELSIYILEQFRGVPFSTDVVLNISSNYKLIASEKKKLVNEIRENYGLDIRENLLMLRFQRFKELVVLFFGLLLIALAHFFDSEVYYNLQQMISIFGWVLVYECFSCLSFVNTKLRYQNKRYEKLIKSKIIFTEPADDNLEVKSNGLSSKKNYKTDLKSDLISEDADNQKKIKS